MHYKRSRKRRAWSLAEALEARSLLTTITVTSLADNLDDDGETTLREAILQAEATTDPDDIVFETGLSGVINLTLGTLKIGHSDLTVTGNGRDQTIIDGGGAGVIFSDEFFELNSTFRSMTLRNAETAISAYVYDYDLGGGQILIENALITGHTGVAVDLEGFDYVDNAYPTRPTAIIRNTTISGNRSRGVRFKFGLNAILEDSVIEDNDGGGVSAVGAGYGADFAPVTTISRSAIKGNHGGGGIVQSEGVLHIEDSVISGNEAPTGGGISSITSGSGESLTIVRSTISGNTADENGGGVASRNRVATIVNSTISGNTATLGGGIFLAHQVLRNPAFELKNSTIHSNSATVSGGGIYREGTLSTQFESNVIAENSAAISGPDFGFGDLPNSGDVLDFFKHNLLGSNADSLFTATGSGSVDADGNLIGSATSPIDPLLGPLTNSGILLVHVPNSGSPAIDQGSNPLNLTTDQVGNARVNVTNGKISTGAVQGALGPLSIAAVSVQEGHAGIINLVFNVSLDFAADGPFTVTASTLDGTATVASGDYQPHTETLSFAGTAGETKQVTVQVNGDRFVESDESLSLVLGNLSGANFALPPSAAGVLLDDDTGGSIRIEGTRLIVTGGSLDDLIEFELVDSVIEINVNGETAEIDQNAIDLIEVVGDSGDDSVIAKFLTTAMLIDVGSGNDTVKGGLGDDTILGGDGNDNLRGTQGNDLIVGGDGDDSLRGQTGDDTIRGGSGNDTLRGSDGEDVLRGGRHGDEIDGGDGNDVLIGNGGRDTIVAGAGADKLRGGGGHDSMVGGAGNDQLGGGNGRDTLIGNSGNDYLNAGNGADQLIGGDGNDTLRGRGGDDVLLGGAGKDHLQGFTGRDIIVGGIGADLVLGNGDNDLIVAGTITPDEGLTILSHLSGGLRNEWLSNRSYAQRVENIRNGSGASENRLNTTFLIGANRSNQNVFDDGVEDDLRGGNNLDFFFARLGSDLLDQESGETIDDI